MATIHDGYKWEEVCTYYSIPRTSLKNHMSSKTKSRKMNPPSILTKQEKEELVDYFEEMEELWHPLKLYNKKQRLLI